MYLQTHTFAIACRFRSGFCFLLFVCFPIYSQSNPIILPSLAHTTNKLTMSRPPVASRNPFVPPPNIVTLSAASWSPQGLTFNVLFSIMDQSRQFPQEQDFQSNLSNSLWPNSDQAWPSFSSDTTTSPNDPEGSQAHFNIDHILNSVGKALSAFSFSLQHKITACGMCLEDYQSSDQIVVLPCHPSHFFHRDCLRDWFKEDLNCPLCRKRFGPH